MYWIVGCPPGGSAGTSFCSGTEMAINLRAMAFPCFLVRLVVALFPNVKEARAFAQCAFRRQESDQYAGLLRARGVGGYASCIYGREPAARREGSGGRN